MKQVWLVVTVALVVILALGLAIRVEAEEPAEKVAEVFIIDGYLPDQFSVKGEVEEKLNELVSQLQVVQLGQGEKLLISVIGSADSSGRSFNNDQLARLRAEQVAAVLSSQFPNAVVKSWSAGDSENIRKVKVVFTVEKAEEVAVINELETPTKPIWKESLILVGTVGISVIAVVAFGFLFLRKAQLQPQKVQIQQIEKAELIQSKILQKQVQEVVIGEYLIPIEYRDGFYWSPFVSKNGNPIRRESFSDIKRSVKGCLENSEFAQQKEKLIQEGIIKRKGGG